MAQAILAHPDLELVEVAGHADATGTAQRNLELTRERSRAVAARLVSNGVAPERLRAVGYSNLCPIDLGKGDDANEKNRRVELVVVRRAGTQISEGGGCPKAVDNDVVKPIAGAAIGEGAEPAAAACDNLTKLPTPARTVRTTAPLDVRAWQASDCDRAGIRRYIAHHERVACGLPPNGEETVLKMLSVGQALRNLAATYPADDAERKALLQRAIAVVEQAHAIATKYFQSGTAAETRDHATASLALTYAAAGLHDDALALVAELAYPRSDSYYRAIALPHALYLAALGKRGAEQKSTLERALAMLRESNQYRGTSLDRERVPYYVVEAAIWRALGHDAEAESIERWVVSRATCMELWLGDLRPFPDWLRAGKVTDDDPENY